MTDTTATPPPSEGQDIKPIALEDELKRSYLDYAMSVIVSRALPDVRDGLKPVHRRILYAMYESGYFHNKQYRKSARVVGDVIGKYHPHGDQAVYDALVRMAQEFSMRVQLIDGQGNFGSIDNDPAAAMRYTEVRLQKVANALLDDLDKDTVDFQENYDGSESEPRVLPARYPNLLVNGAGGIAVGMATSIPPHNLGEVIDGTIALIDDPELDENDLIDIIPGPDFPTAATIIGRAGIRSAYTTGRGGILMRSRATIETIRKDREAIIVTEIPYQVNKAALIERIAELVRDKKIEGISDLRDESDRKGIRIVVELKRDAVGEVVLNQLYRFTALQTSFGANMLALSGGRPQTLNLRDMLQAFIAFREEVVTRRTKFLLNKARDRAHVLVGLAIAVANIDEVIRLIRSSPDAAAARQALLSRSWPASDMSSLIALVDDPRHSLGEDGTCRLSEEQARAILDLRLQRLTALGRDEISEEMNRLAVEIKDYLDILGSRIRVMEIIKTELTEVREQFATPRRTEILEAEGDFEDEDLIQREEMVVTFSHAGYVKRVPLSAYRAQRRGGKGRSGMQTRDEDFVTRLFVASTHTPMLFFSSRGIVYKIKVWRLPQAAPNGKGKALINLLPLEQGERITTILPLPEDEDSWENYNIMFATRSGRIRRNALTDFQRINRNGKIAMKLDNAEDALVNVHLCTQDDDVFVSTAKGQAIRFPVENVRVFKGRDSSGVRGINLADNDYVISMAILRHVDATSEERAAYMKQAAAFRRALGDDVEEDDTTLEATEALPQERYEFMSAQEQIILTVSENGFGKRSSSYDYRVTARGGKGITAMALNERNGDLIAAFPIEENDQIMLVTNAGKLIRTPVTDVRIAGRATQGVRIFHTADDEKVVSVESITETTDEDDIADDTDVSSDDT